MFNFTGCVYDADPSTARLRSLNFFALLSTQQSLQKKGTGWLSCNCSRTRTSNFLRGVNVLYCIYEGGPEDCSVKFLVDRRCLHDSELQTENTKCHCCILGMLFIYNFPHFKLMLSDWLWYILHQNTYVPQHHLPKASLWWFSSGATRQPWALCYKHQYTFMYVCVCVYQSLVDQWNLSEEGISGTVLNS